MPPAPRIAAIVATVLLASCATISHEFTCPAQGGAEWRELRSEHVLLQTDLSRAKAEELLRDAELMRALVLAALFKQPPQLPDRIHLVAFRTDRELWEFTGDEGRNSYLATFALLVEERSADPFLAVAPAWGKNRSSYLGDLTHAITWHVSSHLFPGQPDWYRVGLATYMETLAFDDHGGRHVVGTLPPEIVAPPWEVTDTLAITLAGGSPRYGDVGLRSPGWMLVRWLSEARPTEYLAFLKKISAGGGGTSAWIEVFPHWNPQSPEQMALLEAELKAFYATGKLRYREVTASVAPTWKTRPLATSEVHELRIRIRRDSMVLRATMDGDIRWNEGTAQDKAVALTARLAAETAAEAAEALAEDPLHPVALRLAAGEKAIDQTKARASAEAYPSDWRAWLLLGDAQKGSDVEGAKGAYRKAAELGRGEPTALLGVATGYLDMGDPVAALPVAREAARLAPFSDEALAVLAVSAARTGACPEALVTARRLRGRLPSRKDANLVGLLEQVTSRCAAGGPTDGR